MLSRILLLGLMLMPLSGRAATYCVASSTALQGALDAAAASSNSDEIRLLSGSYPISFAVDAIVIGSLTISGGWNAGCFSAMRDRGLELFVGHHDLLVENSVFSANLHEGLKVWRYGNLPGLRIVSNFNTLADNGAGVWLADGSAVNVSTDVRILNTVSTRTVYADLTLAYFSDVLVRNSMVEPPALIYATLSANSGNNLSGEPNLDAQLGPLPGSILIHAGAFDPDYIPKQDFVGNARVRGVAPDIGAFEQ